MTSNHFFKSFTIQRQVLRAFILLFDTFVWWYMTLIIMDTVTENIKATSMQTLVLWTIYDVLVIGSGVVGFVLSRRIGRFRFVYLWIALGAFSSLFPVIFGSNTVFHAFVIFPIWGFSFGLGIPSCLTHFADCAPIEKRGRISGVIFLFVNLSAPLFSILFGVFNFLAISIISATWRGFGLISFFFLRPKKEVTKEKGKHSSLMSVFRNRPFILYFIAWLSFCFVDQLEIPILRKFFGSEVWNFRIMFEPIISSLSALVGGILCDRIGRKRIVIYGFIALGLTYAFIGIVPEVSIFWYMHIVVDGIAWGVFMVTFVLTLWGDLSEPSTREQYYVVGSIPFFLTDFVRLLSIPLVESISVSAAFSLASFFLFVAVLPLIYAPETLPERKIELRRVRRYVEAARKVKEKYKEKGVKG
jgi:MFS family permease